MDKADVKLMISLDEIDKTILELEQRDTSFATCERLAWLYIVRDHTPGGLPAVKTTAAGSEFLNACHDKNADDVLRVIDEHMECVKLLYPKEYKTLIEKISSM